MKKLWKSFISLFKLNYSCSLLYCTQITQMRQIFTGIIKISVNPLNLCHLCAI
jgi:hypothetical protein